MRRQIAGYVQYFAGNFTDLSDAFIDGDNICRNFRFSLDSIVTAVGLTQFLPVMITAVVIAVIIMMFALGPVSDFIQRHPSAKMLALSFLLLVGAALVPDGMHFHIPRGFLYFAIAFSIMVEVLNLTASKRRSRKHA